MTSEISNEFWWPYEWGALGPDDIPYETPFEAYEEYMKGAVEPEAPVKLMRYDYGPLYAEDIETPLEAYYDYLSNTGFLPEHRITKLMETLSNDPEAKDLDDRLLAKVIKAAGSFYLFSGVYDYWPPDEDDFDRKIHRPGLTEPL